MHETTRAHQRYEVRLGAEVRTPTGIVRGATHDVSRGGCKLESLLPLPEGAELTVNLCVVVDGAKDQDYPNITTTAQVRWTAEATSGGERVQLAGLSFSGLSDAQAEWIEKVVARAAAMR